MTIALPPTHDAPPVTDPDAIEADSALAARLSSIAELSFPDKISSNDAWPFVWQHQAGIYASAAVLDPTQSRYSRLRADALAQIHDLDKEAEALHQAVLAKPDDEFSWDKRLDIFLSQMQTGDLQVKYLRDVMASNLVPADVRAHAGFRCAQTLMDRGEDAMAASVLEEALRDNPSSVECLKMRYAMLPSTATRYERCERLLDLLRANPLQSTYTAELAELTAGSGLIRQSLPWFMLAVGSAHQQGLPAQLTMLDYAAALDINDQRTDAARVVAALLQIDPKYYPAWFMEVLLARAGGDSDQLNKTLQIANNVFSNRIVEVVNKIAPPKINPPTTRTINSGGAYPLPDLAPVVAELNHDGNPQAKRLFVDAVADLARFQIYFAQQPAASGGLLEALHGVLPDNDSRLADLQGWADMLSNKPDDARSKLTSIAADDPLAQLGLIKLMSANPDNQQQTESLARKLVQDNPSGLVGAIIWEGVHTPRVKMVLTPQAVALGQQLTAFPSNLLGVAERPQGLYSIHVQPLMVGRYFSEPLLVRVTIENTSNADLTVGDDGVLKPQMIFDLTAKTGKLPKFKAVDTLACPTVIKPHLFVNQVVRVDQSQMLSFLNDNADLAYEISGVLNTNETANGLGGYPVPFMKSFYHLAGPALPGNMDRAINEIAAGRPEQKITSLSILERFVQKLKDIKAADGSPNKAVPVLMEAIHKSRSDEIAAVSAWATKCEFELVGDSDRAAIISDLSDDADWRHREIAVLLVPQADPTLAKQLLAKLVLDPQTCVRADATAMLGLMNVPGAIPTTAPTTAPSSH